ncbi:MAG: glycosyltransferase family 4 protein [Acidobacteriota bacterium]
MHLVIFNWRDPDHPAAGGAEGYLAMVARGFVARGHRVSWICGRHADQAASAELDGVRIHRMGGRYGVYVHAAVAYLRRFRGQVDVIIDGENGIPFFTPFYSRVPKILLVHHVHREVFRYELPHLQARIASWLESRFMPWAYRHEWCVTVSASTRSELAALGFEEERLAVVHNGLDHASFAPGAKTPEPSILWIGRMQRYKCLDTLVDAAARWQRDGRDLRLRLAGDGPDRARLERRVAELGLTDMVEFLGFVADDDKVRRLREAHLVVQTSMKEGWGMTVIEANACGTPVVASDVAGLRDSVRDGETGVLVPWGDAAALADAVAGLFDAPERLEALGHAARAWARQFSWQECADRWLELASARLDSARHGHARRDGGTIPAELRYDRVARDSIMSSTRHVANGGRLVAQPSMSGAA